MITSIITEDSDFTFEDILAYEFFASNVNELFMPGTETIPTGEQVVEEIQLLAESSYLIAKVFANARAKHKQSINTNEQDN